LEDVVASRRSPVVVVLTSVGDGSDATRRQRHEAADAAVEAAEQA
jgi:hypothetical protein